MQKEIIKTLKYFHYFQYSPTLEEIYIFLPIKTTRSELKKELHSNQKVKYYNNRYTVEEYSIKYQKSNIKYQISEKKIQKIQPYVKLLGIFPQIKLIGLSGTVAMMNAKKDDDIDLFIITASNRLWTGRLLAIFLAQILGLRRRRGVKKAKDKVCLNLFFDEAHLDVPDFKRTTYVAHEILQMKPLVNKNNLYEKFLRANCWLINFFPNAEEILNIKYQISNIHSKYQISKNHQIADYIEKIAALTQHFIIKRHRTKEIITDHQLWFFPDDFEKNLSVLS